jgi:hypothetical protein
MTALISAFHRELHEDARPIKKESFIERAQSFLPTCTAQWERVPIRLERLPGLRLSVEVCLQPG